jgi:endonuclease YncB( thermonuclease family)
VRGSAVALPALFLSACIVVPRPYWDEVPTAQQHQTDPVDQVRPGDTVRVRTIKNNIHVFRVYKVDDKAFYGVASNEKKYRVPFASLASLQVQRMEMEVITGRSYPFGLP